MLRVLVTRPEPGASATAQLLTERGFEPVLLPLTRTSAKAMSILPEAEAFDVLVVTSANALRHAPTGAVASYSHLPCFSVGARTARIAKEAGFTTVKSADGTVADLASLLVRSLPTGTRILYLCGQTRRPTLEQTLDVGGYAVAALETYSTGAIKYSPGELSTRFAGRSIDALLVYSPHAAARLSALAWETEFARHTQAARILCMSAQIAQALDASLKQRVEIAAGPDEKSLLALLGRAN